MADSLPTVWPADPHTLAKLRILEKYLQAWMPILSRSTKRVVSPSREVLYVDGFAGPGVYSKGERGSPVVALEAALGHSRPFPVPIRMIFIEKDEAQFQHLQGVLARYSDEIQSSKQVLLDPARCGDCDAILNGILDEHERKGIRFGPALVFLDQFGYSQVSMQLAGRVLQYPQCEVFSYLDFTGMNRFITDSTKWETFTRVYGGEEWRRAVEMNQVERETHFVDSYKTALSQRGGAKYVVSFAMFDTFHKLLYWLFFCTGNLRGLEEMKRAMWKVDRSGEFRFSDKHGPDQLYLWDSYTQEWLADHLATHLTGQILKVQEIWEYVLTQTPCYLFNDALGALERTGKVSPIDAPANRRRGSFKKYPAMRVRFL